MGVHLRSKAIANGKQSLYLDFYPPVKGKDGRFTRREFLNRYLYSKPKNDDERRINKENKHFAESVRLKREREILNEIDGLYNASNKSKDFIEFFDKCVENRMNNNDNYGNWKSAANYLKAYTGGYCKMGDITDIFCNDFKRYLLTTKKLKTIRNLKLSQNAASSYFNKFCAAVTEAVNARLINEDPIKFLDRIKDEETIREFLTEEELQKLMNTECDAPEWKRICMFAGLSGLRWSDMENLRWCDIQRTGDNYFIYRMQKKTNISINHPISDTAVSLLGPFGSALGKIFEGLEYSAHNNEIIQEWVNRAGINKKISMHNFRHTYATILLNKGVDILTVSKLLGHKDIRTTMRYAKVLTQTKIDAANLIDICVKST